MARSNMVIKTKLVAPRVKRTALRRSRLLDVLKKNLDKKLVLICGDAGYGKSTLIAQLCAEMEDPYVYYALAPADSDLTTFFHYLVSGIRNSCPRFGKRTESILGQTQDPEIIVGTLINEFVGSIHDEFYILLDDHHYVQDNEAITRALDYLLLHQPQNMHLVITSRVIPGFDLMFYRTKQELFEINATALRFDHDELRTLLHDMHHLVLPDSEIERIIEHSQGWITAVQLIMQKIVMTGEPQVKETLNGYVASGEELFDYFAREVFEHQSMKVQDFMLHTSFLRTLTPRLCNRLLKIRSSGSVLRKLEREHAFIAQISAGVYVYHPLFRAFINSRAVKRFSRTRITALHGIVGQYFIEQGDPESALDAYMQGGIYKKAGALLKKVYDDYIQSARFNRLARWLDMFPDEFLQQDNGLQNIKASVLWHTMSINEALAIYEHVIKQARKRQEAKNLFSALYGAARIFTSQGRFADVIAYLKRCLAIPRIPQLRMVDVYNLLGICYVYGNKFNVAESMFGKAVRILKRHGGIEQNASLMNNCAIVAFTKGELERSVRMFRTLAQSHANRLAEAHVFANIALALIDLGRLDEAAEALVASFRLSRQYTNVRAFQQFLLGLGFYHLEQNNFQKAEHYFIRVLRASEDAQERLSEQKARHGLLKLHYLKRDTAAARLALAEVLQKDTLVPGVRNHDAFLLKGLIEIQSGESEKAERTFLDALSMVQDTEFKYSRMKNLYHCAFLYHAKGMHQRTEHYLEQALNIARRYHYDYFLVRQVRYSSELLEYAAEKHIESSYAERILLKAMRLSRITVNLFGSFGVSVHGRMLGSSAWQTRKAQVVFAYCLLNRHHPIAKDALISMFASQDRPAQADQDIRTTVSRVQRAMPWKKVISYERGFYHVHPGLDVRIDAEEFERLSSPLIEHSGPLDSSMKNQIQQALVLYQNDFLVGFYDQWSDTMRNHYKDRYLHLLYILAEHYRIKGEHEQALHAYEKITTIDPMHERAQSGLLQVFLALHRVSDAQKHYDGLCRMMREETGIDLPKDLNEYLKTT